MTGHELIHALQALDERDLLLTVAWSECCPAYMDCDKYHPITAIHREMRHVYSNKGVHREIPFLELEE